ncbi:MAG: aspartate kinase [Alphaproteobacteria bacterium]|nr:aspartate kinase [Alphaproteobacteria bacterium]
MALIVIKFGGSSVSDIDHIKNAASKVAQEARRGNKVVVVTAAMAGATDQLMGYCRSITNHPNPRELDAVLAVGEQIAAGLLVMALEQRGLNARSWQGWQIPLVTDNDHNNARITHVDIKKIKERLEAGEVAVVAGFQGVTEDGSIATLGRGGSDSSAIALAAALGVDRCDIYTNVDGIYTANPNIVSRARRLSKVSHEEMLELSSLGARVLQARAIELALRHKMPFQVLSTFSNQIGSDLPGTLITKEADIMDTHPVSGIAHERGIAKITLHGLPDQPGVAANVLGVLARAGFNVDMIAQASAGDGYDASISVTVVRAEMERAVETLRSEQDSLKFSTIITNDNVAKIRIVGMGMRTRHGIAALMFQALAEKSINIYLIETSEISITVLILEEYLELALRTLHTVFNLDKDG